MATITIIVNYSCIFAHLLLLVSAHASWSIVITHSVDNTSFGFSFLCESPRWLISKGREDKAYKILFNKKYDKPITKPKEQTKKEEAEKSTPAEPNQSKWGSMFKELNALYGPPKLRRMALICHFTWCVTALSYYVTGKHFHLLSQVCTSIH